MNMTETLLLGPHTLLLCRGTPLLPHSTYSVRSMIVVLTCLLLPVVIVLLSSVAHSQNIKFNLAASSQCPLSQSWSTTFPDTSFINPLYLCDCQLIAFNNSNDFYPLTTRLVGIDLRTGTSLWTYGVDLPYSYNSGTQVVASPSTASRLFVVNSNGSRLDVGCTMVTAMAYDVSGGLKPVWAQPVCGVWGAAQLLTFTFPSREVLLLVTSAYQGLPSFYVSLDAATGEVLYRAANVTRVYWVTQLSTATDGLFAVFQRYSQYDASLASYRLSDSGELTQLANISWNGQPWVDVQYLYRYNTQTSIILPLQNSQQRQLWQGWDLRTGEKAWEMSGDDLFTDKWAAVYPGFYPLYPGFVDQHPTNSSWLLVTASAQNGSNYYIYQYGILDTWTGNVTARSALFPPVKDAGDLNGQSQWWAVDERVIVTRTLCSAYVCLWRAFDAQTLSLISTGPLNSVVGVTTLGFLSATNSTASIYTISGPRMAGSIRTADALKRPPSEEVKRS